jgi:hypothetical protein
MAEIEVVLLLELLDLSQKLVEKMHKRIMQSCTDVIRMKITEQIEFHGGTAQGCRRCTIMTS